MKWLVILGFLLAGLPFAASALARTSIVDAGPDRIQDIELLGRLLETADGLPVHIVYVHGMRAEGPGASANMRSALRKAGFSESAAEPRTIRPVGPDWPRNATYAGRAIWTAQSWAASQPFRDRYRLHRGNVSVVIDEINWWPLLFPLKCMALLEQEGVFSGLDRQHLELCARSDPPYYPWLDGDALRRALATRPAAGRGAWPNALVKRQIFNWGLADAVIALGTMRGPITEAIEWAFADLQMEEAPADRRVIVAESLGSFVVLDAVARGTPATRAFVETTSDFYFFANQFALLELARIEGLEVASGDPAASRDPAGGATSALLTLAALPVRSPAALRSEPPRPRQIIAFSDPSDMLSWPVPCLPGVKVVNLMVPMTGGPFRLFAHPVRAHRGHLDDPAVWSLLLDGEPEPRRRDESVLRCPVPVITGK